MRFQLRILSIAMLSIHFMSWTCEIHARSVSRTDDGSAVLAPVVVSASKRGQTLGRLNGSASVVDRTSLDDDQVTSTLELSRVFPELYTSHSATFLFPIITLRGVTSAQDFYNPALTVYVDGVPQLSTSPCWASSRWSCSRGHKVRCMARVPRVACSILCLESRAEFPNSLHVLEYRIGMAINCRSRVQAH